MAKMHDSNSSRQPDITDAEGKTTLISDTFTTDLNISVYFQFNDAPQ